MVFIDHLQEMSQQELCYLVLLICDVFLFSHCDTTDNNHNTNLAKLAGKISTNFLQFQTALGLFTCA